MRVRFEIFEAFQYFHAFLFGVLDLLGKHQVFFGSVGGEALLLDIPALPFADKLQTIQQHSRVCAFSIAVICRGFFVLLVLIAKLLEKFHDLLLNLFKAEHFAVRVDHKLVEEVLDLDVLAESEGVWIEVEADVVLGEVVSKGEHLEL